MNSLYNLKGNYTSKKYTRRVGPRNIPTTKFVSLKHLEKLLSDLTEVQETWKKDENLELKLVTIKYNKIISKSNRIQQFFRNFGVEPTSSVVGAKFYNLTTDTMAHMVTYAFKQDNIDKTLEDFKKVVEIVREYYGDSISYKDLQAIKYKITLPNTRFIGFIVDSYYISKIEIYENDLEIMDKRVVTLFDTFDREYNEEDVIDLLAKYEIDVSKKMFLDRNNIVLPKSDLELLKERAPYLVSMEVENTFRVINDYYQDLIDEKHFIPSPKDEPVIGVIDSMYNGDVYFDEWVKSENFCEKGIYIRDIHAEKVISIIVDGPSLNPSLDDGCGRFRVRHFGILSDNSNTMESVFKNIRKIVNENKDIKVWNLSLGSEREVSEDYISLVGSLLDDLQYENDIIFVVAGTNNNQAGTKKRIGEPADSINSIVVNSVNFKDESCNYTRIGEVLHFFNKPDVAYYGGEGKEIKTCSHEGTVFAEGTSYAAPWITRKIAYLIYVMKLPKEIAKALIIDSAAKWDIELKESKLKGYGIVPIKINDVLKSNDDEIKFYLTGKIDEYETYNHNIPLPIYNDKHPYVAKAILCYTPKCDRNQGVDYTLSELDFHFGRIKNSVDSSLDKISSIDNNHQAQLKFTNIKEEDARRLYRKWDNVKLLSDKNLVTNKPRKVLGNGLWGLDLKVKERTKTKYGKNITFGIVVTFKETEGVNRIEEFVKQCTLRGWIVNEVNVDTRVELFNELQEEVEFN